MFKKLLVYILGFIKKHRALVLIFFLALLLRSYQLSEIPHGFHEDEVDVGYIGRYLVTHGKDLYGNFLPIHIDKFGDFRPAGIFYVTGFGTFLFGVSQWGVRMVSALFGALTVFSLYFFVLELLKNKKTALFSSLFLAILPWHIVLSRATSEAIIGLFFLLLGFALVIRSLESKNRSLITGGVFLFMCYFFYHSFRLVIPFLLVALLILEIGNKKNIKRLVLITAVFFIISLSFIFTQAGSARYRQVAIYNSPFIKPTIDQLNQGEGQNHVLRARIFHNKIVVTTREFLKHAVSYYSPLYLFYEGGFPFRYQIPDQGLVYFSLIPFLLLGFITPLGKEDIRKKGFLLLFAAVAVLPAALTFEDAPNVHRSLLLMVPILIFAAIGFNWAFIMFKKPVFRNIFLAVILFLFVLEIVYFYHQYMIHAPSHKSVTRNDGTLVMIKKIIEDKEKYSTVILPGLYDVPLYYLFTTRNFNFPQENRFSIGNKINAIGDIILLDGECPSYHPDLKKIKKSSSELIVDNGNCEVKDGLVVLDSIHRKDSTLAYRFLRRK